MTQAKISKFYILNKMDRLQIKIASKISKPLHLNQSQIVHIRGQGLVASVSQGRRHLDLTAQALMKEILTLLARLEFAQVMIHRFKLNKKLISSHSSPQRNR